MKKKIKILGLVYDVEVIDSEDKRLLLDNYLRAGITNKRQQKIYLSDDLTPDMFKRVLTHELTHAFIYASGLQQVDWNEEIVADFLEARLTDIYKAYEELLKL